jgi:hypothetical protein
MAAATSAVARRPGLWITSAVLLVAAVLGLLQRRGSLVDVARVTRVDTEQHLVASGRVRVVTPVKVTAQAAGPRHAGGGPRGVNPESFQAFTDLRRTIVRGSLDVASGHVVNGSSLAADLGVGDRIP